MLHIPTWPIKILLTFWRSWDSSVVLRSECAHLWQLAGRIVGFFVSREPHFRAESAEWNRPCGKGATQDRDTHPAPTSSLLGSDLWWISGEICWRRTPQFFGTQCSSLKNPTSKFRRRFLLLGRVFLYGPVPSTCICLNGDLDGDLIHSDEQDLLEQLTMESTGQEIFFDCATCLTRQLP